MTHVVVAIFPAQIRLLPLLLLLLLPPVAGQGSAASVEDTPRRAAVPPRPSMLGPCPAPFPLARL